MCTSMDMESVQRPASDKLINDNISEMGPMY